MAGAMVYKRVFNKNERQNECPYDTCVHAWRSEGPGETAEHLPVPEGAYKGLLTSTHKKF